VNLAVATGLAVFAIELQLVRLRNEIVATFDDREPPSS